MPFFLPLLAGLGTRLASMATAKKAGEIEDPEDALNYLDKAPFGELALDLDIKKKNPGLYSISPKGQGLARDIPRIYTGGVSEAMEELLKLRRRNAAPTGFGGLGVLDEFKGPTLFQL